MMILYAALFWIPFSMFYLTFDTYGGTWTFFMLCIAVLTPFACIKYFTQSRFNYGFGTDVCVIALTLLFLFFLMFNAPGSSTAYKTVHGLLIPAASYIVVKSLIHTEKRFFTCLKVMMGGFSLYALCTLLIFIITGENNRIVNYFGRDSITSAALSCWVVLFALYTPLLKGIAKYVVIIVNAAGLLLSLSRSLITTTAGSPLLIQRFFAKNMFVILVVFFASTLAITTVLVSRVDVFTFNNWNPEMEHTTARLTNMEYWKRSIHGRLYSFKPSMERIKNAPIFGNGFPGYRGSTVHNLHMELLEYGGIVGYLLFVLIFIAHFWSARAYFSKDRYLLVGAIFILFMLINGLLNGVLHGLAPLLIFIQLGFNESRLIIIKRKAKSNNRQAISQPDKALGVLL